MEALGLPHISSEHLLTYSPSNWSQWSTWFLDYSQFQFGSLTVVLRTQRWTNPHDRAERYYYAPSHPNPVPQTTVSSSSRNTLKHSINVHPSSGQPDEESYDFPSCRTRDIHPATDYDFGPNALSTPSGTSLSQDKTLFHLFKPFPIKDEKLLEQLRFHSHCLALDKLARLESELPKFWQLIMCTLSNHSRIVVMADQRYLQFQSNYDVLGLWKLIAYIHTRGKGKAAL
jgi:hypothetical protein